MPQFIRSQRVGHVLATEQQSDGPALALVPSGMMAPRVATLGSA